MQYVIYIPENSKCGGFMHYGTKGHSGRHKYGSGLYAFQDLRRSGVMDWSLAGQLQGHERAKAAIQHASERAQKEHGHYDSKYEKKYGTFTKEEADSLKREKLSELPKLKGTEDIIRTRMNINHPDQTKSSGRGNLNSAGRNFNCPNCAAAVEMVARGYDVIAKPKLNGSNADVEDIAKLFKNGKFEAVGADQFELPEKMNKANEAIKKVAFVDNKPTNLKEVGRYLKDVAKGMPYAFTQEKAYTKWQHETISKVEEAIKAQGEGARGIIVAGQAEDVYHLDTRTNSFHAFNYEVTKDKGLVYYDAYFNNPYYSMGATTYATSLSGADPRDIYVMRTDNLELSPEITRAVASNPNHES